jgi:hypothetical protein
LISDIAANQPDEETGSRGFPDNRPAVAAFTDLMTAALGAVQIQQTLGALDISRDRNSVIHRITTGGNHER